MILPLYRFTLFVLLLATVARAERFSPQVLERARMAAVEVLVAGQIKGGGAFISEDGYGISAAHLWAEPKLPGEVVSEQFGRLPISVLGFDLGHDLVIWKAAVTNAVHLLPATALPALGEPLACLGPSLRNPIQVLFGRVSYEQSLFAEYKPSGGYLECLLVNGFAPGLTSGGPWIDQQGQLVGVQCGFLNDDKMRHSGLSLIAPAFAVAELQQGKADAATAGIGGWVWELWTAHLDHIAYYPTGIEGLIITHVMPGGALDKAGLKKLELITHVDGLALRRRSDFLGVVRSKSPGQTVDLTVMREGSIEPRSVVLTLDSLEQKWRERPIGAKAEDGNGS